MKILVTGVTGQLGFDVVRTLIKEGHEAVGTGRKGVFESLVQDNIVANIPYISMDITNETDVIKIIKEINPEAIIHCAAWTAVDDAEDNEEAAFKVNELGTKNLANAAKMVEAKFVYISTDYVFDGKGITPYQPDNSNCNPTSVYGASKLAGEEAVKNILEKYFIVRISWVFGINGANFVKTMLQVGKNHDKVTVVNDQIGSPTYTYDLSHLLIDMIKTENYGTYHARNEGDFISWYDFTREIYKQANLSTEIVPVTTEEYGISKAARPLNSRLDTSKLNLNNFNTLPMWQDALKRYLKELKLTEGDL
ncbi:dTDP-4-dehydrorhamnose reductase [Carnobacterium sp. PL12RED10]|uniref:dTDP-4-dehydrorhamnose reductase n=1 Tax=Carnobacterium sp. PL12RED10 TaxID=2592351 RepID=UPI0011ED7C1A|nr:dTDP-4-dehydrorhamnose reductase [Carnobacterium sp. PL12RED10]KAF3302253.1 dTDP-4-dehydrorhamnose reductase [Carnobacterium sp. PL12RED10]